MPPGTRTVALAAREVTFDDPLPTLTVYVRVYVPFGISLKTTLRLELLLLFLNPRLLTVTLYVTRPENRCSKPKS
jgi:hypothetical protein